MNGQPVGVPLQVQARAVQGGVHVTIVAGPMMTQLLLPENVIDGIVTALKTEKEKIPKVVLAGIVKP